MADNPQLPRPWFISLALVWKDDKKASKKLHTALEKLKNPAGKKNTSPLIIPPHHMTVPKPAQHCTAFAILEINHKPSRESPQLDFARDVFNRLLNPNAVLESLRESWRTMFPRGLTLEAWELHIYDDGTAVQFRQLEEGAHAKQLERLRNKMFEIFREPVWRLLDSELQPKLTPLTCNSSKSRGGDTYGSIARSPCRSDRAHLRYKILLDPIPFSFTRARLVVSDEALTNPRENGTDEFII